MFLTKLFWQVLVQKLGHCKRTILLMIFVKFSTNFVFRTCLLEGKLDSSSSNMNFLFHIAHVIKLIQILFWSNIMHIIFFTLPPERTIYYAYFKWNDFTKRGIIFSRFRNEFNQNNVVTLNYVSKAIETSCTFSCCNYPWNNFDKQGQTFISQPESCGFKYNSICLHLLQKQPLTKMMPFSAGFLSN